MRKKPRLLAADLKAASQLLVDATTSTSEVVEAMQHGFAPALLKAPMRGANAVVHGSIRGITRAVGAVLTQTFDALGPALGAKAPGPQRLAVMAALNGVVGDLLAQQGNALALPLELLRHGRPPKATGRVVVLLHGSSMNDLQWLRSGHDHGAALQRQLGCSVVYVRYNTGLHVSVNGRQLAAALERWLKRWPVEVEELTLLGFSMGGLVARSAVHFAEAAKHQWRSVLKNLVTLGTPHHGSPLERTGNWAELFLGLTPYTAPLTRLGRIRSAGVTDLRFGNVLDSHWEGKNRFALERDDRAPLPLPGGVRCFAVAGTQSEGPSKSLRGDGLVPVASALGKHDRADLTLAFPKRHQRVVYGATHLDLLSRPEVFDALEAWLG